MTAIPTNTKLSVALAMATALFIVTYYSFSVYNPKALRELREVKGLASEIQSDIISLPYPYDAENISTNKTLDSQQTTFSTQKTPGEIQNFYENILAGKWVLKEESENDTFFVRQYKKDDTFVYIWSSKSNGDEKTYASVEILKYEK